MILLFGMAEERCLALVRARLDDMGAPYVLLDQRFIPDVDVWAEVVAGEIRGELLVDGQRHALQDVTSAFLHLVQSRVPDTADGGPGSESRRHRRRVYDILDQWCDLAHGRVVNRPRATGSNGSKPFQSQLISAMGFTVPDTIVTNQPSEVRAFREKHGQIIYKSLSGVRSVVKRVDDEDMARLDDIRWCPVQFQELVEGTDLRVHTVDDQAFATLVESDATDYRYAKRQGFQPARLSPFDLPDELVSRCVAVTRGLGLAFAGIDLRLTPDGRVVCFEVNPVPSFDWYERHAGQPIAEAVARYLAEPGAAVRRLKPGEAMSGSAG